MNTIKVSLALFLFATGNVMAQDCSSGQRLYKAQLTVPDTDTAPVGLGFNISASFNHAALVSAGKALTGGSDLLLYDQSNGVCLALDVILDESSAWNTTITRVWWRGQRTIPPGTSDTNYWLYSGNPSPTYPNRNVTTFNPMFAQAKNLVNRSLAWAHTTDVLGHDAWFPGCGYNSIGNEYLADISLSMTQAPAEFSCAQIQNTASDFYSLDDGSHNFPFAFSTTTNAPVYFLRGSTHPSGDQINLVFLVYAAYQKCGSTAQFSTMAANLKTMLLTNIPRNPTTHLMTVAQGSADVPWGFQDGVDFSTGGSAFHDNLWGSLRLRYAEVQMAAMYTAIGDSANAAIMTADVATLTSAISSNFYDATSGMYFSSTSVNVQIDVGGSAYACYTGAASGAQCITVSNYILANLSTIESQVYRTGGNGYFLQSPSAWAQCYSAVLSCSANGTYDNGAWAFFTNYIAFAIQQTSPSAAISLITRWANGGNGMMEWWQNTGSPSFNNGFDDQIYAPSGAYGFIAANRSLFPDTVTSVSGAFDPANVWFFYDNFSTNKGWTHAGGTWSTAGNTLTQSPGASGDIKYNLVNQPPYPVRITADMKIDSYTVGFDAPIVGVGVSSIDLNSSGSRGIISAFRGTDTTTSRFLNDNLAWSSGVAFSWTTNTSYRMTVGFFENSGAFAYFRNTWAVGSADPYPAYQEQAPFSLTSIIYTGAVGLSCNVAVCEFQNVIIRGTMNIEPVTTVGVWGSAGIGWIFKGNMSFPGNATVHF